MACGCKGGNNNFRKQQQRTRANLQSPRKPFVPPPTPTITSMNMVPNESLSPNLQLPPTGVPDVSAERRRIQRLQQNAINRRFNR